MVTLAICSNFTRLGDRWLVRLDGEGEVVCARPLDLLLIACIISLQPQPVTKNPPAFLSPRCYYFIVAVPSQ